MDIEYGAKVVDKDGKAVGAVNQIIMDSWSGEPRKFMVRHEENAVFFTPEQVAEVSKEQVKLKLAAGELEQT